MTIDFQTILIIAVVLVAVGVFAFKKSGMKTPQAIKDIEDQARARADELRNRIQPAPAPAPQQVDHAAIIQTALQGAAAVTTAAAPKPGGFGPASPAELYEPEALIDMGIKKPDVIYANWQAAGRPGVTRRGNATDTRGWPLVDGMPYGNSTVSVDRTGTDLGWSNGDWKLAQANAGDVFHYTIGPVPAGYVGGLEVSIGPVANGGDAQAAIDILQGGAAVASCPPDPNARATLAAATPGASYVARLTFTAPGARSVQLNHA